MAQNKHNLLFVSECQSLEKNATFQYLLKNKQASPVMSEYDKDQFIYALVKKRHIERQQRYVTEVTIQYYDSQTEEKQRLNKSRFADYSEHILMNKPQSEDYAWKVVKDLQDTNIDTSPAKVIEPEKTIDIVKTTKTKSKKPTEKSELEQREDTMFDE